MPTQARIQPLSGRQRPAPVDSQRGDNRFWIKRPDAGSRSLDASSEAPDVAEVLQLQRTLGNQAVGQLLATLHSERGAEAQPRRQSGFPSVQRMIRIGDKLFHSGEAIKTQLPGKKDKNVELAQWRKHLADMTENAPTDVSNAYDIPGMNVPTATEGGALNTKLNTGSTIFDYASVSQMNGFLRNLQGGAPENTTPMLLPKDMLDEEADLSMVYDQGKACVLQALINLGIEHPRLDGDQQKDPKAWHTYYLRNGIQYDDDTVLYKIYTGFGLRLVWNKLTLWRNLTKKDIPPGQYVFSSPGHNFAVIVKDSDVPAERFAPKDAPQNMVTEYQPDRKISYIWQAP